MPRRKMTRIRIPIKKIPMSEPYSIDSIVSHEKSHVFHHRSSDIEMGQMAEIDEEDWSTPPTSIRRFGREDAV